MPETYRTVIAHKLIGLLESRLTFCRLMFKLMYTPPIARHMGEYKTPYRIRLRFFGLEYVLMFLNG